MQIPPGLSINKETNDFFVHRGGSMNIEVAVLHDGVGEFVVWDGRENCAYCLEMKDVETAKDVLRELEMAASVLRARIDIVHAKLQGHHAV